MRPLPAPLNLPTLLTKAFRKGVDRRARPKRRRDDKHALTDLLRSLIKLRNKRARHPPNGKKAHPQHEEARQGDNSQFRRHANPASNPHRPLDADLLRRHQAIRPQQTPASGPDRALLPSPQANIFLLNAPGLVRHPGRPHLDARLLLALQRQAENRPGGGRHDHVAGLPPDRRTCLWIVLLLEEGC
jgi:hypothetical protein